MIPNKVPCIGSTIVTIFTSLSALTIVFITTVSRMFRLQRAVTYGLAAGLALVLALPLMAQQEASQIEVVESGQNHLVLRLSGLSPRFDREGFLDPTSHPWVFQRDSFALPELRGTVAVPVDATIVSAQLLQGDAGRGLVQLSGSFARDGKRVNGVIGEREYAGVRLVTLAFDPFDQVGGHLRFQREYTIELSWIRENGPVRSSLPPSLNRFESELNAIIPNYGAALTAGRATEKGRATIRESQFEASSASIGEPALILLVASDGIYQISPGHIADAGGPGGLSIADLRLRRSGELVELWAHDAGTPGVFDGEDVIGFRGERNNSLEGFYFSELSDTNAYVLTWSGGEGDPPGSIEEVTTVDGATGDYSGVLHLEKERTYFGGMTLPGYLQGDEATLHVTERVQHERFYWGTLQSVATAPLTFDLSPSYAGDRSVTMRVRAVGTNFKLTEVAPIALEASVNGTSVGTAFLHDTSDMFLAYEFDANVLINGTNTFHFALSGEDPGVPVSVHFDFIELQGEWLALSSDRALLLPSLETDPLSISIPFQQLQGISPNDQVHLAGDGRYRSLGESELGHLLQVTSRTGTALRSRPGFVLKVGQDQIESDGQNSLGVTVAEVSADGSTILRFLHVRTTGSLIEMDQVADFVDEVENGNIVVAGLAFGTAQQEKTLRFVSTFEALGSASVSTESFFASAWVFAAIKGNPGSAVEEYQRGSDGLGISTNLFITDEVNGLSRRRSIAPSEAILTPVTIGIPREPLIRYYAGDQLRGGAKSADLVIVTHPLFREEADRLAAYRRTNSGLEVEVVDVYQIYDEFNYGQKDPDAIRQFLQHADSNWGGGVKGPSYVILFGDANWDRNQRLDLSTMIDYIPSFGVPSTDQKFVAAYGDTTLTPQAFIGRIPATSPADARAVVDKIIQYENQDPAFWNKRVVFATGGTSVAERDRLRDQGLSLASIITSDRFYGDADVISRTGTTDDDLAFPNDVDAVRVQQSVNRGALWLDFNGHGATTTTDLNFGFVDDFDNEGKLFIFATWSCQTGLFSNIDATLRNESFLTHPTKGSVASIGGTSFSFTNMDNPTRRLIFSKVAEEPDQRSIGAIFHLSKLELYAQFFYGSPFVDQGTRARNQMMMYTLLGDPSMKIATSPTPELTVPIESVALIGERESEPTLGDTVLTVKGALWNFGVPLVGVQRDSVGVPYQITLVDPAGGETVYADTVRGLRRHDTVQTSLNIPQIPGEYVVIIEVDQFNDVTERTESDNRTVLSFLLRGSQPLLLEPVAFGLVDDPDNVTLRLLNPATGPGAEFLLDSLPTFNSPALMRSEESGQITERELTTTWEFSVPPGLRGAEVLWWRALSTSADPDLAKRFPLVGSFRLRSDQDPDMELSIGGVNQMELTSRQNLVNHKRGVGPGTRAVPIFIEAIGQTFQTKQPGSPEISQEKLTVRVGADNLRSFPISGLNVLVFPPNSVEPRRDTFFLLDASGSLAQLEDFVGNVVQQDDLVLVATHGVTFQMFDENAQVRLAAVLDQLGSRIADTIQEFDIWGSYALLGGKGMSDVNVKESYLAGGPLYDLGESPPFAVTLNDTIIAFPSDGLWTSTVVGPSTAWRSAKFHGSTGLSGSLPAVVLGVNRDGSRDTLVRSSFTTESRSIDLATIDPLRNPRIEVLLQFDADTTERLRRLDIDYEPSPELAFVPSTVTFDKDSVLQGEMVKIDATIENVTSYNHSVPLSVLVSELGELGGVVDSTQTISIPPLDSVRVSFQLSTERYRSSRDFALTLNQADQPSEPYSHNNRFGPLSLTVSRDSIPPGLAIYADDSRVISGDYISDQPTFSVRFFDNSKLKLDSLRTVTMVLDNEWITIASGGEFVLPGPGDGELRAEFRYTPPEPLEEGPHDIRVFSKDASGNGDTTEIVTVFVETDLSVRGLYNWPNPMGKETTFTFNVTGNLAPESGEISIFTPAGRKIRTLTLSAGDLAVGHNRVDWDGRDQDGDRIANGVYFYRLKIRSGEEIVEAVEKIAVVR